MGVILFSKKNKNILFSGSKINFYEKFENSITEYKGNKISLGYRIKDHPLHFSKYNIKIKRDAEYFILQMD